MDEPSSEEAFLASYDPRAFEPVAVTVDVVTLTIRDGTLDVLLVQRGVPPFEEQWALPGGFVRSRPAEDLDEAAVRELAEETGQRPGRIHLEQLASYGSPGRDPRMRVISVAYLMFAPELPEPQAGTDARAAAWVPVESLGLAEGGTGQRPGMQDRIGQQLAHHQRGVTDRRGDDARLVQVGADLAARGDHAGRRVRQQHDARRTHLPRTPRPHRIRYDR